MFYIEDDVLYITRGDDATLNISLATEEGVAYEMQDGDSLTLTVRATPDASDDVILSITSEASSINITHDSTANAEVGVYSADIQLLTATGLRKTIWPKLEGDSRKKIKNFSNFVIMPEVTTL